MMAPAKPPVPTPWNLPFHDAPSGIHTSKLMCESGVGVATAATRQKAGTASGLAFGGAGGVNAPAGTLAAEAMVRSRRRSAPSAEHAVPAAGVGLVDASTIEQASNHRERAPAYSAREESACDLGIVSAPRWKCSIDHSQWNWCYSVTDRHGQRTGKH